MSFAVRHFVFLNGRCRSVWCQFCLAVNFFQAGPGSHSILYFAMQVLQILHILQQQCSARQCRLNGGPRVEAAARWWWGWKATSAWNCNPDRKSIISHRCKSNWKLSDHLPPIAYISLFPLLSQLLLELIKFENQQEFTKVSILFPSCDELQYLRMLKKGRSFRHRARWLQVFRDYT